MPEDRETLDRSKELTLAAGISVVVAALVAGASAAGHAIQRDPGPSLPKLRRRHDGGGSEPGGESADGGPAPDPDASFKPDDLTDLHKPTVLYSLKKTAKEFGSDQCTDIAASLVYYSVLALGPAIVAIVSILGLFGSSTISSITTVVKSSLPSGAAGIIGDLIATASKSPAPGLGLVIGILGALWSASGYVGAFGRAMNRIYSVPEGRPVWKLRPTQLLVTLAVVVLVVIGALLLISTGSFVEPIANTIGVGPAALLVFQIVKWPVLVAIAIIAIALLFYFSPNLRQPKFKWTSTGSVLALVVLALATAGLGIYLGVTGGGSYSKTYGPVAGVILFLLWLWIANLALLFGAEFDAELERSRELQAGIAAEEQIQLPLRDTRQSDKKAAKHQEDVEQARRLRRSRGRES